MTRKIFVISGTAIGAFVLTYVLSRNLGVAISCSLVMSITAAANQFSDRLYYKKSRQDKRGRNIAVKLLIVLGIGAISLILLHVLSDDRGLAIGYSLVITIITAATLFGKPSEIIMP